MTMKPKLFVDFHIIQSVPPNCLNRDDSGSPKTAMYGGVRRARVSSQSWKRAMRLMFKEHLNMDELSYRTVKIFDLVAEAIIKKSPELGKDAALEMAKKALAKVKVVDKKKAGSTDALFFISSKQAENLAEIALGSCEDEKEISSALKSDNGIDLALFGRMVATNTELNSDASAQVAHAISTHKSENEYDYFTAIDDLSPEEHAGAGMIGTVEYNSSTLYRYATVSAHKLFELLNNDPNVLAIAMKEFARAFIASIPDGKQNTFAAHSIPYGVLVTLRTDRPVNMSEAFEWPIKSKGDGYVKPSAEALVKYAKGIYADFCPEPESSFIVGEPLTGLGERLPFEEMISRLGQDVAEKVSK